MFRKIDYEEYIKDKILSNETCPLCGKEYSKYGLKNHIKYHFGFENNNKGKESWNKGLTKETDERVKKCSETLHNRIENREIIPVWLGKQHTEESKKKISDSMIVAHKEGRAHNIGESRWNNEPSYPETFIMKVIENELIDKNYIREYTFHKFSFDFAWPHLMKYIEIDGEQHRRFIKQKERDIEKDRLAKEEGWIGLRIYWQYMFNNTKLYINKIKQFIDKI